MPRLARDRRSLPVLVLCAGMLLYLRYSGRPAPPWLQQRTTGAGEPGWPCPEQQPAGAAAADEGGTVAQAKGHPGASAQQLVRARAGRLRAPPTVAPAPQPPPCEAGEAPAGTEWWPCECLDPLCPPAQPAAEACPLAWGRCPTAASDSACASLLEGAPCAATAAELRLGLLGADGEDVYLKVTAADGGCDASGHRLTVLLTSGPWVVPATPIPHRRLPPALQGSAAANSAALFRARLRREWAAADGAWQAQATLIIDGHWGERLRRTSWQRVTRGQGVPLWPGPQSRPASEWRAEEKEQKAAFHAHWAAHAREIPFAHNAGSRAAALTPLRAQIGSPGGESGGGGAHRKPPTAQRRRCRVSELRSATAEGALHTTTRRWQPYTCELAGATPPGVRPPTAAKGERIEAWVRSSTQPKPLHFARPPPNVDTCARAGSDGAGQAPPSRRRLSHVQLLQGPPRRAW